MKSNRLCRLMKLMFPFLALVLGACKTDELRERVQWVNPPQAPSSEVDHMVWRSRAIGARVGASVVVPPNYDPSRPNGYPVIYYLHGWGGDESTDVAPFEAFVEKSLAGTSLTHPILVFVNGGRSGYVGQVERMLLDELIPKVEAQYHADPQRQSRYIAGFSMGGTGAVRFALRNPNVFAGASSFGGRIWRGDDSLQLALGDHAQELNRLNSRFLFTQGELDHPDEFDSLTVSLAKNNIAFEHRILSGVGHNLGDYLDGSVVPFQAFWRHADEKRMGSDT